MALTDAQLNAYQTQLETERERVMANVASLSGELTTSLEDESEDYTARQTHPGDVATATFLRERDLAVEDQEAEVLAEINAALGRIASGTYGVCTACGGEIPTERLDALPWAARDVACERAHGA